MRAGDRVVLTETCHIGLEGVVKFFYPGGTNAKVKLDERKIAVVCAVWILRKL